MEKTQQPGSSQSESDRTNSGEPNAKFPRLSSTTRGRPSHPTRIPIILPRLPSSQTAPVRLITSPPPIAPSTSNPRPLISLLDRTEFKNRQRIAMPSVKRPKKQYYTELEDIRKEFGIPETFDTSTPKTMSEMALSEKLQLLQRLRGENKFLRESIQKKTELCNSKTAAIEHLQKTTMDTLDHCQLVRATLREVEAEGERLRSQIGEEQQ